MPGSDAGYRSSEFIYNKYKDMKTCGVIEEDLEAGIQKVAEPVGVICGVVPTTNPGETAIFKSLIALKTRNAIVFSPHPRAVKSTCDAARIVRDFVASGAAELSLSAALNGFQKMSVHRACDELAAGLVEHVSEGLGVERHLVLRRSAE